MTVRRSTRAKLAALLWHAVGVLLMAWGIRFVLRDWPRAPETTLALVTLGLLLGSAKGLFVFQKVARKTLVRIQEQGEDGFVLKMFRPIVWLIIPLMIGLGITLRHLADQGMIHYNLLAAIYLGVAAGMHLGALPYWRHSLRDGPAQA